MSLWERQNSLVELRLWNTLPYLLHVVRSKYFSHNRLYIIKSSVLCSLSVRLIFWQCLYNAVRRWSFVHGRYIVSSLDLRSSQATWCDAAKYVTSPSSCCPKQEKENWHIRFILTLHSSGFIKCTHIVVVALHCNTDTRMETIICW